MTTNSTSQWMESLWQDLRHGILLLRRDAAMSAVVILILALGIGGNAAIFTLWKAAFLDPLPFRESDRLVTVMESTGWIPSVSEFLEIRARSRTLTELAFAEHTDMQISGIDEPARVYAARVTASFFPLLGVNASLGRIFREEENRPGQTPSLILSDRIWRSKFNADSRILGRTVRLDGTPAIVVGVLPPSFHFDYPTLRIAEPVDIYLAFPLQQTAGMRPSSTGRGTPVRVIGRLAQGVSLTQAESELHSIASALIREYPESFRTPPGSVFTLQTLSLREAIVGTQRNLLWLLAGGVGVLMLIACANTAQLLLARSMRRSREISIRMALGAPRWRLIRQFLLEGIMLAVCGGGLGMMLSIWVMRSVIALLPARSPILESAQLDVRTVFFTLFFSIGSGLLFTILPAWKGTGGRPSLQMGSRGTVGEGNRWRHVMLAVEAALSVFLLCGAGLVAQNLWTLVSAPLGFDPSQVTVLRLQLPMQAQGSPEGKSIPILKDYVTRISAIPQVDSAASVTGPPLRPTRGGPTELSGITDGTGRLKRVVALSNLVSPGYFKALRIPLLAGRVFRDDDAGPRATVAIVNEEFARRFGLGADVVGKDIFEPGTPIRIVGMVGNVRTRALQTDPFPQVYLSSLQLSWPNVYVVVRSSLPTQELVRQVKGAIQSSNSNQAVFGVTTMENFVSDSVTEPRFQVYLAAIFALIAVALAAAGMYSVISFLVSQRTSEIAIRVALGATFSQLVRNILATTMGWFFAGLICGLALSFAARNTIRALSNVSKDPSPWMYFGVALFFFAVTLAAVYRPVRRAGQLDPSVALRNE